MTLSSTTKRWLAIGAPVAVVVLAAAFWWFRPDALFTDRTVDEQLDADVAAVLSSPAADSVRTPSPVPSATPAPTPEATPSPTPQPTPATDVSPTPTATSTPSPTSSSAPAPSDGESSDPVEAEPTGPVVVARGDWTSLEHETSGTVALVDDDGDLQLVLSDLQTDNGPDLRVILSPKEGVEGDWFGYDEGSTSLGALKGNQGTQTYDVPDDLDLDDVASVVIWCERFSVGFGVANL